MSSVYASEPATSGRVLFDTTHGPLEVQLWCRECPATTRFFLQLCLDGYYDGMLFHRIVPSFLVQTGILRRGADGAASVPAEDPAARRRMREYRAAVRADAALERRRYELHSRLRFNHRGQVSMALEVDDAADEEERADLQPQFFVTLEESKNLDGKYVLFGTIAGPTFFNAARIGGMEVDPETHQPVDLANAPRIRSVRILENPIHQDLVPQPTVPWRAPPAPAGAVKKKKRKGKFDRNVLSFGDEVEERSTAVPSGTNDGDDTHRGAEDRGNVTSGVGSGRRSPFEPADEPAVDSSGPHPGGSPQDRAQETGKSDLRYVSFSERQAATAPAPEPVAAPPAPPPPPKSQSILEMRNAKYKKIGVNKKDREDDTLAKLFAFKSKVRGQVAGDAVQTWHEDDSLAARMARRAEAQALPARADATTYHGQVLESDDDEQDQKNQDWLKTTFRCRRHIDHSAGGDGRYVDDYEVVDPQAEGNGDPGMKQSRNHEGRPKHREHERHDHHRHKNHRKHY